MIFRYVKIIKNFVRVAIFLEQTTKIFIFTLKFAIFSNLISSELDKDISTPEWDAKEIYKFSLGIKDKVIFKEFLKKFKKNYLGQKLRPPGQNHSD